MLTKYVCVTYQMPYLRIRRNNLVSTLLEINRVACVLVLGKQLGDILARFQWEFVKEKHLDDL